LFVAASVLLLAARPAAGTISYRVSLDHPEKHILHVGMEIPNASKETAVALPAWNALYQVRDFACRVQEVRARWGTAESASANPIQSDKNTWRMFVVAPGGTLNVSYSIVWDDPGPFNSQLDAHHAFINLAEILMYVPDRRNEDSAVNFENIPAGWHIRAELPAGRRGDSFIAPSYDALVDAPVEAGKVREFSFDEGGAHFRVVVDSKESGGDRLEEYLRSITRYEMKLMGGAPFKEYTFIFHIGPYSEVGGGGMEHSNSTAIAAISDEFAASIAAHEFFHAWNVKRIRPQSLEPVDYTREQYTRALWFAEGVTSTYSAYTMERSGLWSRDQFYGDLASQIRALESRPARKWQSVEESSLDAWLEKYDAYNVPDRSISYYNKGQILGVMLDLAVRDATDNHKSLDDVFRHMNDVYAKQGKFYNDTEGVRVAIEEVSGRSFADFFARYVSGTADIPYSTFLAAAGLELNVRTVESADLGFVSGRASATGLTVSSVEAGSTAEAAGLQEDDLITQVNDRALPKGRGAWRLGLSPGEPAKLYIERDGQQMYISYRVGKREDEVYTIAEIAHPTDKQRRIRNGLLRGTTD
jgi:predicted metalloprotease with PDZ domain